MQPVRFSPAKDIMQLFIWQRVSDASQESEGPIYAALGGCNIDFHSCYHSLWYT